MKVEIVRVTDKSLNPKEERIWGSVRDLTVDGEIAFLVYEDNPTKCRRTSFIESIVIADLSITITTRNSVYELMLK